jgi:hypothetical protein
MIEMTLLVEGKQTDNKVRWDVDIEGTKFSLHIPKWRVPEPWPAVIQVFVEPSTGDMAPGLLRSETVEDPSSLRKPIIADLVLFEWKTRTIRYKPRIPKRLTELVRNEQSLAEIGEPYIPIEMTFDGAEHLRFTVHWKPELEPLS